MTIPTPVPLTLNGWLPDRQFSRLYQCTPQSSNAIIEVHIRMFRPHIANKIGHDAQVIYFDADLPSIANYRVLPGDYEVHVPEFPESFVTPNVSPIIVLDQEHKALVRDWYGVLDWREDNIYMYARNSLTGNRTSYTEKLVNGDSSHPMFVLMNGELVLLSATFTINTVTPPYISVSPFYPTDIGAINAAMTTLENDNGGSDGYQLSVWTPPADVQSVLVGGASANQVLVGA